MGFVGKLLLIIGLGATLLGGFEVWLLWRGTKEAEQITLEELGKRDGTNNVHLTITNFALGKSFIGRKNKDEEWQIVWVPLLSPEGKWTPRPVVAWSNAVHNQDELAALYKRRTLTGVVSNGKQSVGQNQREMLAQKYPNVDLSGAIAFEIDGKFPSPLIAYPITAVGVIFLALGLRSFFGRFRAPASSQLSEVGDVTRIPRA
ncbi:MAG TPA: hypothetical protein VEI07_10715 [Planctomycetaceae bacterium]|nr:hypothetical protein [Planctomycetaceae bacterium]